MGSNVNEACPLGRVWVPAMMGCSIEGEIRRLGGYYSIQGLEEEQNALASEPLQEREVVSVVEWLVTALRK